MGRPIKKTNFSTSYSPGATGIGEVTAYFPVGGTLQQNDNSYVVSQRGSKRFKVHQANDSSEAVYTLKSVAPASLVAGECCIKVILDDSALAYVERFYNRTIHYVTEAGNSGTCTYTLGAEGTDEQRNATDSNIGSIDVI